MTTYPEGKAFPADLSARIKEKFLYVDVDYNHRNRLFFENAGGSFTLKAALDVYTEVEAIGDCPERIHATADYLNAFINKGIEDIRIIAGDDEARVMTMLTASQVVFEMTRVAAENLPGTNIVTTKLEHPSAYDSAKVYAAKTGKELRVAEVNQATGGVDAKTICQLIDKDTAFLSVIYASNISGAILDLPEIVKQARAINPDLYIIVDAVQHVPHCAINMKALALDAVVFAPYKFFGIRGLGVGCLSGRFAKLPHHKLIAKPEDEWELGSPAPAQFAAISAIVDYVCWLGEQFSSDRNRRNLFVVGMTHIALHERMLLNRLLEGSQEVPGLRRQPNVSVFLDDPDLSRRDLIVALGIDNLDFSQAVLEYDKKNVTVFERVATSLYSKRMVEAFGLKGAVRVSPLHCHSCADVDVFLSVTQALAQKFNGR